MEDKESTHKFDPETLADHLPIYYKRLFPYTSFYRWLSYGCSEPSIFTNREISFTLVNDIYIRYLSFETENELKNEICSRYPYKIDIGAVMSRRPSNRESMGHMEPVQRELVFDIDLTDYDDVRTCCDGANVCQKCWKYMTVACNILDITLREDFGYEHILWVFSGRRGIHCWVCDKNARYLSTKSRSALAEYIQVVQNSGENGITRISLGIEKIHPSVKRALNIIEPMFEDVCLIDQEILKSQNGLSKLLQMISDENVKKDLEIHLRNSGGGNSKDIWNSFVQYMDSLRVNGRLTKKMKYIVEEIQLMFMYPRLDINVTKGLNHLLKAPFCIHPKTGKVCVPFNPNAAKNFDPTAVPTITTLFEEINKFDDKEDDSDGRSRIKDIKKTSLLKSFIVFEEFLRKLESSYKKKAILVSDAKKEF